MYAQYCKKQNTIIIKGSQKHSKLDIKPDCSYILIFVTKSTRPLRGYGVQEPWRVTELVHSETDKEQEVGEFQFSLEGMGS